LVEITLVDIGFIYQMSEWCGIIDMARRGRACSLVWQYCSSI